MKVSEDLLMKADSSQDPNVRQLAEDIRTLEAEDLKGKAFHERARRMTVLDGVLRQVLHGGVPLAGAMQQAGLEPLTPPVPLGMNQGDIAATPRTRR